MSTILPTNIFNERKSDYERSKPFFNEALGLSDTINRNFKDIHGLFKQLKEQDWDELEFDYSTCNQEFKSCKRNYYDGMIKTLAYQWETDSVAASIFPLVISSINPSTEIFEYFIKVSENEQLHAATYSEIVRNSFDNPETVMAEILEVKQSLERLSTVAEVFSKTKEMVLKYALDNTTYSQELYNQVYLFFVAVFCMERIQFMASFAITFNICETTKMFQPIGAAIRKIALDEYEVHVQGCKAILKHMNNQEEGKIAYQANKDLIVKLIDEVVANEERWNEYLFSEVELVGLNLKLINDWVRFSASDVALYLGVQDEVYFDIIKENPLPFMEGWLKIDNVQMSPQEEQPTNYKLGVVVDDSSDEEFDVDF